MFKKSCLAALVVGISALFVISPLQAALTHGVETRDSLASQINKIANGANYSKVILLTSGDSPLDTVVLQNPAFSQSTDTLTAIGVPISSTAANAGTIAKFKVITNGGLTIFQGTAGTSGTDVIVDNTSVTAGQIVQLTGLKWISCP